MGYGLINAKAVKKVIKINTIWIKVWGNHKCGLERNDRYGIDCRIIPSKA